MYRSRSCQRFVFPAKVWRFRLRLVALLLPLAVCLLSGCGDERIDSGYGRRMGFSHGESVCGTAVLAEMFAHRGHTIGSWSTLSPRIDEAQTIVWFPDDFSGPGAEVRERLELWLSEKAGRTLIYVGRDFDAPTAYWDKVLSQAPAPPPGKLKKMQSRQSDAIADAGLDRSGLEDQEKCEWFSIDRLQKERKVITLADSPWFDSSDTAITPANLEIELAARLIPHRSDSSGFEDDWLREDLLISGSDPLVTRLTRGDWDESQLLIVQNGSFLVNLSLVNPEHRLLAGALIGEIESFGGEKQKVLFLESSQGGPKVLDSDPTSAEPTGPIHQPPVSYIVYHLIVIGVLAIFACWPIFGRPREMPGAPRSDFGKHVRWLGAMLSRSGDETYCRTRILHYEQTCHGEIQNNPTRGEP